MDNKYLLILFAVITTMDIWDEVLVVWHIMLCRSDIILCGLRKMDRMDWRLLLCFNNARLLVHSNSYIPWKY
jgi:hypothetical protein